MKNILFISTSLVLFLLLQCSTTRKSMNSETYPFEISFGETGGFTNMNPVFKIMNSGELLKQENERSAFHLVKKIEKSKIDSIYILINKSDFSKLSINKVSNITHYIQIKSDKINNTVKWSDDFQIPDHLRKLYQYISDILN